MSVDTDLVTLTRAEYEALLARIEDAEDAAAMAERRALEVRIGPDMAAANDLPATFVDRLLAGEQPLRIWRERRGLTAEALAAVAGVSPACIVAIENGGSAGDTATMVKLARALGLAIDDLRPVTFLGP